MLDDLALIHERDAVDTLGIVEKQWEQLQQTFELPPEVTLEGVEQVVYAGMGGSAFAAFISQSWPDQKLPITLVRNYDLPSFVGPKTLVIVSSYSGNTEEALEALNQAEAKAAKIVVMAAGGKLQEVSQARAHPFILLPQVAQPRYAILCMYKALLAILDRASLLQDSAGTMAEITAAADFLKTQTVLWRADVATKDNPAKQLAQELMGKSIVIYSGPKLAPAGYKWKISFNENAKQIAWVNQFPEFNHNEFIGWSKQPTDKPYAVIDLRSTLEHPRVQKRFEITAKLLSGMRPEPHIVQAQGETLLQHILWTMAFGDFVTIYLALLNGLNPAPVDLVEKFKEEMAKD
jgi:glucose/mannose-6-phosphate isomerase